MSKNIFTVLLALFLCCSFFSITGCRSTIAAQQTELGKKQFENGYYKRALKSLLPAAVEGNPEAQYGVGYMYYYGYGVAQDMDTGMFWIQKAADQHYKPAVDALRVIRSSPKPPAMRVVPAQTESGVDY